MKFLEPNNYKVEWSSEYTGYQIVDIKDQENYFEHLADIDSDLEVIGNLWENPELLAPVSAD